MNHCGHAMCCRTRLTVVAINAVLSWIIITWSDRHCPQSGTWLHHSNTCPALHYRTCVTERWPKSPLSDKFGNVLNSSRIHRSHKPLWCCKPSRDWTVTITLCLFSVWSTLLPFPFSTHLPFLPHPSLSLFLTCSCFLYFILRLMCICTDFKLDFNLYWGLWPICN